MARSNITRRTVLKGLLGGAAVTIGLPTLELFTNDSGTALAGGTLFPKRFGLFFWGNGILPEKWVPTGEGAGDDWQLSEQLESLAQIKDVLTVVSGMRVQTGNRIAHGSGPSGFLTGAPLEVISGENHTYTQPTLDQVLAQAIGGETRFRSLEIGVQAGVAGLSHNGPHSTNPPESSPYALFQRIFGEGFVAPGEEPIIDPRLGLRRSVLDAVMDDANRLRANVGAADRVRLDQHFDGIRDLERRLAILEEDPPNLASCEKPAEPAMAFPDVDGRPPLDEINAVMADLTAMALACDQTRVFSTWFTQPLNNLLFPGANSGHHQLTHDEPGDQPQVNAIVKYIVAQYGVLIDRLRQVPEGDGTLLDNCVVLGTTDCSYARQHALEDYPILLAGSAGGYLVQNFHYRSISAENTSKVALTLLRAMGMTLGEFGVDGGYVDDGLGAIEV